MEKTLRFPDLLRLLDERSTAFRAVVGSAPDLDLPVPTCPGWTLFDLARHVGEGRRSWAATIAAGPAATEKVAGEGEVPEQREPLSAWLAESVEELSGALREAGPDRRCRTWWGRSQSPETCGAVARHQVQEVAMHTYDAQVALGVPQPLPEEVALDGVEEFLSTCCAWTGTWPHKPAAIDFHAAEGRSWRLSLSAGGGVLTGVSDEAADASVRGTASELVLMFYDRVPVESLRITGDRGLIDLLREWDPDQ